jgi:pilus assembly protein FimV
MDAGEGTGAGPGAEEISLPEMKAGETASSFFDEDEDESIGLTGNELDNILKDTDVVAAQVDESLGVSPDEPFLPVGEAEGLTPARGLPGQERMNPEQLKKILQYLDNLLDYLPEEKIKEFAKSEYFDLYHSHFNDLKI